MFFSGDTAPTMPEMARTRNYLIEKIIQGEISTFFVQQAPEVFGIKPLVYQTPPKLLMPAD